MATADSNGTDESHLINALIYERGFRDRDPGTVFPTEVAHARWERPLWRKAADLITVKLQWALVRFVTRNDRDGCDYCDNVQVEVCPSCLHVR